MAAWIWAEVCLPLTSSKPELASEVLVSDAIVFIRVSASAMISMRMPVLVIVFV